MTNAILNLIYPDLNAKTELKLVSQLDNAMIQYISAKPYFLVDAFPEIAKNRLSFSKSYRNAIFIYSRGGEMLTGRAVSGKLSPMFIMKIEFAHHRRGIFLHR